MKILCLSDLHLRMNECELPVFLSLKKGRRALPRRPSMNWIDFSSALDETKDFLVGSVAVRNRLHQLPLSHFVPSVQQ